MAVLIIDKTTVVAAQIASNIRSGKFFLTKGIWVNKEEDIVLVEFGA